MTMTETSTQDSLPPGGTDRRQHHRVRAVFEDALQLIEPFFAPENQWGTHSLEHLAYHALRDNYPDMSVEEVHILVVAAKRIFNTRQTF